MKFLNKTWSVLVLAIAVSSCRPHMDVSSRLKFRPADPNAKNVALIVGAPNDLSGVAKDVQEVSKLLRESNLGYEVTVIPRATVSDVMIKAKALGETLSENSTVLFYFSGHGSQQGYLFAQGLQQFRLSSVAKSFSAGFGKGKYKRFIAVMDSCFSGQNVNGNQAMFLSQPSARQSSQDLADILSSSVGHMASDLKPKSDPNLPFEQALVLSAAQRNQESLDMGPSIGGAFTFALRKVLKKDLSSPGQMTLGQVLEEAKRETIRQSGGSHTPAWKAMPETMLDEPLTPVGSDPNAIFVALGESQSPLIFVSLPSNLAPTAVELCRGDVAACSGVSGPTPLALIQAVDLKVASRMIFRTNGGYPVAEGDVLTMLVRTANGSVSQAQSVKITRR
jgi:hypothetical protein